jgi:hypothetical protein
MDHLFASWMEGAITIYLHYVCRSTEESETWGREAMHCVRDWRATNPGWPQSYFGDPSVETVGKSLNLDKIDPLARLAEMT